jgi:precorrin-6A/cobalt-precorrin-6A reductase
VTGTSRILVLGGTSEATELSSQLRASGHDVVLSFAGRTNPLDLPPGSKRIGGFDGVQGLMDELREGGYRLLIDATHPFATEMAEHAEVAAGLAGVPHIRIVRPPWEPAPGATWHDVDGFEQAARRLAEIDARRAFLAIGSRHVAAFAGMQGVALVVRSIEPPSPPPPEHVTVLLARGPFTVDAELALFRENRIDVLVARNSGGRATEAKLDAACRLGIPVIMVRRPEERHGGQVTTVAEVLAWVDARLPGPPGSDEVRSTAQASPEPEPPATS